MNGRKLGHSLTALMVLSGALLPLHAQRLEPTTSALIDLSGPSGWSTELRLQRDRRQFLLDGGDVLDIRADHVVFRLGAQVAPFMLLWAETGIDRAEIAGKKGDMGLEWAVGGHLKLLEYILSETPVVGKTEGLSLELDVGYRSCESRFPERRLRWADLRIIPVVAYRRDRIGEYRWHHAEPSGVVMRGGLVFNRTTGSFDSTDLEEKGDFGAMAEVSLRWHEGWMTNMRGVFFGREEREISIGVGLHF